MKRQTLAVLAAVAVSSAGTVWATDVAQSSGYPAFVSAAADSPPGAAKLASQTTATVTIHAPKDGALVPAGDSVIIDYTVNPGPQGDHVHFYVDGKEVDVVRKLAGQYRLAPLSPGAHEIAIKVVNSAHVPIGVESSIRLTVR
jgi:hypothetical protein